MTKPFPLRVTDVERQPFRSMGFVSVIIVSALFALGLPLVLSVASASIRLSGTEGSPSGSVRRRISRRTRRTSFR